MFLSLSLSSYILMTYPAIQNISKISNLLVNPAFEFLMLTLILVAIISGFLFCIIVNYCYQFLDFTEILSLAFTSINIENVIVFISNIWGARSLCLLCDVQWGLNFNLCFIPLPKFLLTIPKD